LGHILNLTGFIDLNDKRLRIWPVGIAGPKSNRDVANGIRRPADKPGAGINGEVVRSDGFFPGYR
jgi:hypothetical protein